MIARLIVVLVMAFALTVDVHAQMLCHPSVDKMDKGELKRQMDDQGSRYEKMQKKPRSGEWGKKKQRAEEEKLFLRSADLACRLGVLLFEQGKHKEALTAFLLALGANPLHLEAMKYAQALSQQEQEVNRPSQELPFY